MGQSLPSTWATVGKYESGLISVNNQHENCPHSRAATRALLLEGQHCEVHEQRRDWLKKHRGSRTCSGVAHWQMAPKERMARDAGNTPCRLLIGGTFRGRCLTLLSRIERLAPSTSFMRLVRFCHSVCTATVWQQDPLWTQQIGGLMGVAPAHLTLRSQLLAHNQPSRCSSFARNPARPRKSLAGEGSSSERRRQEQEVLWRQFFLDPTLWWDNRQSSGSPDFRRKGSSEVLWLNNFCKPAWVDEQLAALDIQMGRRAPTSKSSLLDVFDPGRPPGYKMGVTAVTVSTMCQQGKLTEAVEALEGLVQTDCPISKSLFYTVLKQCAAKKDLVLGRRVHALTVKMGYESDTFLCNHVLRMYASHARLQEAMDVFSMVAKPDTFMWFSIISAHVKNRQAKQAIQLYHQMRGSRVKPNSHVFIAVLQACAKGADLKTGRQVHTDVLAGGVEPDLFVCNAVVDMYAKCGSLEDAQRVFDRLPQKDVVTWTALIAGYAQHGMGQKALQLYSDMQEEGIAAPDSVTFVCLLQACASVGTMAMEKGKRLHAQIAERGLEADGVLGCSLVNMYAKCGSLENAQGVFDSLHKKDVVTWNAMVAGYAKYGSLDDAQRVFDKVPQKNVATWNAMIAGYSQQGMGQEALRLYSAMQEGAIAPPNSVTFVCLLQACASVGSTAMEKAKQLHAQIREQGLEADEVVGCSLVNMYAKCGSLEDAQRVFDRLHGKDVVTWTAMIAGYSQQGMGQEALHLYSAMQEEGIAAPNSVTFVCLLQACAIVGSTAVEMGKQLHAQIEERGLQAELFVANSLINMYAKCGSLEDAQKLFDTLRQKDVVTWTAMIAGYSQQGMGQEALHLYSAMRKEGLDAPDSVTFVCLLQACANVAGLHPGRHLHAQIIEQGFQADVFVANSLINMYAKSGSMVDAQQVFDALPERDVFAWNALIAGYTFLGDSEGVFALMHRMAEDDIQPDSITFLSVLTVCSHAGLVNKGREYFEAMSTQYGITPTLDHYTCMVDLLGRAGQLDEALEVVRTMPVRANHVVWHAVLGACRKWSNVDVGRHAFDEAVKLDEKDATAYVMMYNIYAAAQMREDAEDMQAKRKQIGARKQPGQSWWTDLSGKVHAFVVGDKTHPESDGIYARLKQLVPKMKKDGYVPHLDSSIRGISDEDKEAHLCGHSEKLAIAYALNKTPEGTTIRIVKNLRVCEDCHRATAYISKIEKRTIICRDASRFHVYKDGKCSCGDYW